jgi:predicted HAD superfamily Cof-like phosphohydrolase
MTEFARVKKWMASVGQDTKHNPMEALLPEVLDLRMKLLHEEMLEVFQIHDEYEQCMVEDNIPEKVTADLVKELCDLLVVTHGFLVALGVNGAKAFEAVMDENDAKIAHAEFRGDGKVVTPPKIKSQLKTETRRRLTRLVAKK